MRTVNITYVYYLEWKKFHSSLERR